MMNSYLFMTFFWSLSSSQQKTIINAMAVNDDGVMATGGVYDLALFLLFAFLSLFQ